MSKVSALLHSCRKHDIRAVVIGASAGGVDALKKVLTSFKKPSQLSVAAVLHIPPHRPNLVPELFKDLCDFSVQEPHSHDPFLPENIYMAPPDYHLNLERKGTLSLSTEEPVNFSRPSIDVLFESAAHAYGNRCLAMLLTGANSDGAEGLKTVRRLGGLAVVQDPEEAEFPTMPSSGLALVPDASVLTVTQLSELIQRLCGENFGRS